MVVNMYIIGPKKDQFKPVFFSLFDFSKMKRPRSRLQKTNKQSFLVLVLFDLSPVWLQSFASPRTGLSNTTPPCCFKPDCSSPTPTMSIWVQPLVSHHHCVNLSPTACVSLPPCQFEPDCSSPTSTTSFWAWLLVSHSHHVLSIPIAHVPPPLHQFEPNCSSSTSTISI